MYETMQWNATQGYPYGYSNPMMGEPMKPALMTQALTPEEMAILSDKGGAFSTKVTQEDMYKAYCTHKRNGKIVAQNNPDGSFTCPICGETFDFRPLDKAAVEEDVQKVIDDMQSIKLAFLDISVETARQYFPIIPLLRKLPQLAVMAANNFAKYENPNVADPTIATPYGYAAYAQLMNGGAMMPMMNQYYGAVPAGYPAAPAAGVPMMAAQPTQPQTVYVDAYGRPMIPNYGTGVQPNGMPMTNNQAQAAMMMGGGNEFVAPPAAPAQPTMVTPPIIAGQTAPAATPVATQMAPTSYTPQPAVSVTVNPGVAVPPTKDAQPPVPKGEPVVEVSSFQV